MGLHALQRLYLLLSLEIKLIHLTRSPQTLNNSTARMKALMRSSVFWPNIDKEIEANVKSFRGCAIAAKVPPMKFTPWTKTDRPWSKLHIDFAGPMKGLYYLIVVDSFSKWSEVNKYKNSMCSGTIRSLHALFAMEIMPKEKILPEEKNTSRRKILPEEKNTSKIKKEGFCGVAGTPLQDRQV